MRANNNNDIIPTSMPAIIIILYVGALLVQLKHLSSNWTTSDLRLRSYTSFLMHIRLNFGVDLIHGVSKTTTTKNTKHN